MITSLAEMKDSKLRIGIADPQSDVLGAFTVEMLKRNNIYESINHRLILTGPSALDLTERVSKCEIDVGVAWTMSTNWNPESFDVVLLVPNEIPRVAAITAVRAASPRSLLKYIPQVGLPDQRIGYPHVCPGSVHRRET